MMVPLANLMSYPDFSMAGRPSSPMMVMEAPIMPVDAASNVQIRITVTPRPPLRPPMEMWSESNRFSATPDLSSRQAMNTNSGPADINELVHQPGGGLGKQIKDIPLLPPEQGPEENSHGPEGKGQRVPKHEENQNSDKR